MDIGMTQFMPWRCSCCWSLAWWLWRGDSKTTIGTEDEMFSNLQYSINHYDQYLVHMAFIIAGVVAGFWRRWCSQRGRAGFAKIWFSESMVWAFFPSYFLVPQRMISSMSWSQIVFNWVLFRGSQRIWLEVGCVDLVVSSGRLPRAASLCEIAVHQIRTSGR